MVDSKGVRIEGGARIRDGVDEEHVEVGASSGGVKVEMTLEGTVLTC